jgi:tRNA threonylcarbamoyladenosine biosynthesis protein TsaB
MLVLTIRTDNPEAEIGLYEDGSKLAYDSWHAHRELSATLLSHIEALLQGQNKTLKDLNGIVCFQGPGSFTGLRIGLTVADTLVYGLDLPIVAAMEEGWIQTGLERLQAGEDDRIALPHYGAPVHITQQKK